MTGVLLVNMGSPSSQKEMKHFLFHMFCDPAILPFARIQRYLLAFFISRIRYKGSWKKYELIDGSPLKESMKAMEDALSLVLGDGYRVNSAYSYSLPTIKQGVEEFRKEGITSIKVIPMYPQSSFSTTGSVRADLATVEKKHPDIRISVTDAFSADKSFIAYWVSLIHETIQKNGYDKPVLLFSAHAIPAYQVEKGDTYTEEITTSAFSIAEACGLPYQVSYQSKIGRVKWVGPDTKACLKEMKNKGLDQVILVPISFINENLETLYDLDTEIIPYAKNESGFNNICRVNIPFVHPMLIETFRKLVIES